MISVQTNMLAMNAQRQYKVNTDIKRKSTEKLSSGYKINRAADDAAGLTISEKMRSMIRGLNQGTDNTQDGISYCQVADGAMAEIHDMIHRLKELAVKSANGTNTQEDRAAIDKEAQALIDELNRIDESTEFNTKPVFLRGNTILDVENEPGDLEYYNATKNGSDKTYGGFLFHGERIPFSEVKNEDGDPIVKMKDGVQVFNKGEYTYTNSAGQFFTLRAYEENPVPEIKREITIEASDAGISFDGTLVGWDKFYNDEGRSFVEVGPQYGTWHTQYGRSTVYFTLETNNSLRNKSEFITAINHYNDMQENAGVSYHWTTELDDEPLEKSVYLDAATFAGASYSRQVDNDMAYDSNCDIITKERNMYNLNENNSGLGYTLRAVKVNSDPTEIAKSGTDENVNIELFLVGSDGKKINGSSQIISLPMNESTYPAIDGTKNSLDSLSGGHSIESFSSGKDITDGDYCDGNIKDGVTDFSYHYIDNSGKTDIQFDFRLSDVSSADTVEDGLDLAKFVQEYKSRYTDKISDSSSKNSKVTILNDGETRYSVSYNIETALGRDFSKSDDVLAVIDGGNAGDEDKVYYIESNKTIYFGVHGNDIDKTSGDYGTSKDDNTVGILHFNASTEIDESEMSTSIVSNTNELIYNKIVSVIDGGASDNVSFDPTITAYSRKVNLADSNVRAVGSTYDTDFDRTRSYSFDYDYEDIFDVFNSGSSLTTSLGEKITIQMENLDGDYNARTNSTTSRDRWLLLSDDIKVGGNTRTAGQYIDCKTLTDGIKDARVYGNAYIRTSRYVFDEINGKYVNQDEYRKNIETSVSANNVIADGKTYVVDEDGMITEKGALKTRYKGEYGSKLSDVLSGIPSTGYKDGSDNPLLGEDLRTGILAEIDSLSTPGLDPSAIAKIKSVISDPSLDFSAYASDSDGNFSISTIIDDTLKGSLASSLADDKLNAVIADKHAVDTTDTTNIELLIGSSASVGLKQVLMDNYVSDKLPTGEFTLNTTLKNDVFKASKVAENALTNPATVTLGKTQPTGKEISSEDMKELALKAINGFNSSLSKDISDYLKQYINDNWDDVKSTLNLSDGRFAFTSDFVYNFSDAVIDQFTDGKIQTIRAYYGTSLADGEVTQDEFTSGSYSQIMPTKESDKEAALKTKVDEAANGYASQAMQDIADSMKFTMKADDFSYTLMRTIKPKNSVNRPEYESVIELEYKDSIYIQHSNVIGDETEINKFCMNAAALRLSTLKLDTERHAKKALEKVDFALSYVSDKRSYIGAVQNRLEHTIRNNENKAENLTAAESRIRDTDMAKEMMNQAKMNIILQVGESMMSQANQSTQGVLSLLQ